MANIKEKTVSKLVQEIKSSPKSFFNLILTDPSCRPNLLAISAMVSPL